MRPILCVAIIICLSFSSCDIVRNDDDLTPYFLKFDSVDVEVKPQEGFDSHNIQDVWVIADGQDVGVFELPVTLPILDDNEKTDVTIFAGIRESGIQSNPIEYPFYEGITFEQDNEPNATIEKDLTFEYRDNIIFEFIDEFEGQTFFTNEIDEFDNSFFAIKNDPERMDNRAGVLHATEEDPICEVTSSFALIADETLGRKPFLEVDFKGTAPLQIGIQAVSNSIIEKYYEIILKPRDDWKKLYLGLTDIVSDSNIDEYRILLGIDIRGFGETEAEAWVDNVKLVRFQ